jgi:diadenosine tetraphosphate (Ap4A) HIT family hydrolase
MTYDPNNLFARILRKEIPCNAVYEDAVALAFHDISPAAPVHVLVVSKHPARSFDDFVTTAPVEEVAAFFASVRHVASLLGVQEDGYRLIANHGAHASQTIPHFHVHILAGKPLGGLLVDDVRQR